ncbi:MAG: hypothetical protein R3F59_12415 [Myxococcota bacterium]
MGGVRGVLQAHDPVAEQIPPGALVAAVGARRDQEERLERALQLLHEVADGQIRGEREPQHLLGLDPRHGRVGRGVAGDEQEGAPPALLDAVEPDAAGREEHGQLVGLVLADAAALEPQPHQPLVDEPGRGLELADLQRRAVLPGVADRGEAQLRVAHPSVEQDADEVRQRLLRQLARISPMEPVTSRANSTPSESGWSSLSRASRTAPWGRISEVGVVLPEHGRGRGRARPGERDVRGVAVLP